MHHAFVIEADHEKGIAFALSHIARELRLKTEGNPDVIVLSYGLLSVEDARRVIELASGVPFVGDTKAIVIAADRAYHEAQNALLKLFEEPPRGTHLFLVMPNMGGLLPTLRSRVVELSAQEDVEKSILSKEAEEFLRGSKEKRTALIKKLSTGRDEDERRENRDTAIAIVNGIEATYAKAGVAKHAASLAEIATLRDYLYDRSAPVKMILEHLSIVTPTLR